MKFYTHIALFALMLGTTALVFAQTTPPLPVELPGIAADAKALNMTSGSEWAFRTSPVIVLGKTYENYAYVSRTFVQYVFFNIKNSTDTFSTDIAYANTSTGMTGKVVFEINGDPYQTMTIKQGEAPQHLEIPFTGKSTLRISPSDDKILFLNPRLLPGAPVVVTPPVAVKPVADPLVDKLVALIIQIRATALAQNNKVSADSLEKSLLDIGIKLTSTAGGATNWEHVVTPATVPVTTPPVVPTTPPTVPPVPPAPAK